MKYAISKDERIEATPNKNALCPACESSVIAKCGSERIHHWAHKVRRNCDRWYENETQWHRDWKNLFPSEWQEFVLHAQSGEKHIADVRNPHGLVVELQHSYITPEERISREDFYRNMVWVVDGTRLKNDYPRFRKNIESLRKIPMQGVFLAHFPEEHFPKMWLNSSVPVLFDFLGLRKPEEVEEVERLLWCLLPNRAEGNAVVMGVSRQQFVERVTEFPQIFPDTPQNFVEGIAKYLQDLNRKGEVARLRQQNPQPWRRRRSRRL